VVAGLATALGRAGWIRRADRLRARRGALATGSGETSERYARDADQGWNTSGVGIHPRGVFLGTYAIGVYVEAGVRDVADDLGAFHVNGGLTFRTPLVFQP